MSVEQADGTEAEVQHRGRGETRGVTGAVHELVRRGMLRQRRRDPFVPTTRDLGLEIDVSNIAEALDYLEGPESR